MSRSKSRVDFNVRPLISQVGDFRPGVSREAQHQCLVDGLKEAAPILEEAGVTLVIEPLNELVDHAGYYLIRSDEAFQIIEEVDNPRVKVVFDIYHQQISEGHVISTITTNIDKIAHFHAAGNPGRHELTIGELHYPSIFEAINKTNLRRLRRLGILAHERSPDRTEGSRKLVLEIHHLSRLRDRPDFKLQICSGLRT